MEGVYGKKLKLLLKKNGAKISRLIFIMIHDGNYNCWGVKELKSIDFAKTISIIRNFLCLLYLYLLFWNISSIINELI